MDVGEDGPKPFKLKMSCHIGCIALKPDNLIQPCYNREKYVYGDAIQHRHLIKYDDILPDYIRDLSPAGISDIMTKTAESGFFVTYNHPTWCMQSYDEYINYNGMHATEIFNGGCLLMGYEDSDAKIYDDFLRTGRHLYCIGSDDNHNYYEMGDALCDSGRAFTMIFAEKLEYTSITDALVKGDFYASQGPEIRALWFEDGKIHIEFSDAVLARCNFGVRRAEVAYADGKALCSADFTINPEDKYFRITIIDKNGKKACTNGYFTDDLF